MPNLTPFDERSDKEQQIIIERAIEYFLDHKDDYPNVSTDLVAGLGEIIEIFMNATKDDPLDGNDAPWKDE